MKKAIFSLTVFLIAISTNAQSMQIGIGIGSTIVTSHDFYTNNLSGDVYQEYFISPYSLHALNGLGFDSEYNINIKARLFMRNILFNLYSDICLNRLVGKGTVCVMTSPASSYAPPPQKSESICNLINGCLGVEYQILKKGVIPFLSGGVIFSHLGDIHIKTIEDENLNYDCKAIKGGMRYGLEFGIGFYYKFYKNILIDVSSNYSMNNLLGRESSEEKINTVKTNINILYEL